MLSIPFGNRPQRYGKCPVTDSAPLCNYSVVMPNMFFLVGRGGLLRVRLLRSSSAIPERENLIRDGIGVSLGQSDDLVTIRSLRDESTQQRCLSLLKDLSRYAKRLLA